jgi:hypothetical protein
MAPHFLRARKGEPGGPEMTFTGARTWDSVARENTIGLGGCSGVWAQNGCGRQKFLLIEMDAEMETKMGTQ